MKKKIFAIITIITVLAITIIPSVATEVGTTPYTTTTSLQNYFGQTYNGNIGNENTYTFCIDVIALAQVYAQEGAELAQSSCYLNTNLESNTDIFNVQVEIFDTNVPANTAISIMINDNEVTSLTLQEVQNAGGSNEELYVLIPFSYWDSPTILDTGWLQPNPPYQIFNNIQLTNTRTFKAGYNTGYEIGYNNGYEAGYGQSSADQDIADAGIRAITTAVQAPFNIITEWLNFEVLGVNLLGLLMSLLAIAVIAIIIKAVIK